MLVDAPSSIATLAGMASKPKPEISRDAATEGARLKALFDEKKGERTQAKFAGDIGVTQGMLSQYFSGARPISLKVATAFAKQLNVPFNEVSPSLAPDVIAAYALMDAQLSADSAEPEGDVNTCKQFAKNPVQTEDLQIAQRFSTGLLTAVQEKRVSEDLLSVLQMILDMSVRSGPSGDQAHSKTVKRRGNQRRGSRAG